MKNYDLSKYLLQKDDLIIFPLTKEEVSLLKEDVDGFSKYIRISYLAKQHSEDFLEKIINNMDMEDDYWFLNSLWLCTDIKARAIIGTLNLEKADQFNIITMQVSDEHCKSVNKEDVKKLFYRFLAGNDFINIVIKDLDEAKNED